MKSSFNDAICNCPICKEARDLQKAMTDGLASVFGVKADSPGVSSVPIFDASKMAPFNFEKYKEVKVKIWTNTGIKVDRIVYMPEVSDPAQQLLVLATTSAGKTKALFFGKDGIHQKDPSLYLVMEKKVTMCYINVYRRPSGSLWSGSPCFTKEQAAKLKQVVNRSVLVKTIEFQVEE